MKKSISDDAGVAAKPHWGRGVWVGLLVCIAAFVVLGGVFPSADPPTFLPGLEDRRARELLVEPAAKAHEARNYALFGEFHRNPADNYQFWRVQSPVWVYPLAWTFKTFGVSYPVLHFFSLCVAAIGLLGFIALARHLMDGWAALLSVAIYVTALYVSYVSRSGLIEVMLGSVAVWITLFLVFARKHPIWAVLSQSAFVVGFFAKQGMLYMFPLLVVCNVLAFIHWQRKGIFRRVRWYPVATAVCFALFAVIYILQPSYMRTVVWNIDHMTTGAVTGWPPGASISWTDRFEIKRLLQATLVMTSGLGAVAIPGALWMVYRRRLSWAKAVALGWFFSTLFVLIVIKDWEIRFGSILLLPTAVMTGLVFSRLWYHRDGRTLVAGIASVALALNLYFQVQRLQTTVFTIREAEASAIEAIGERSAVIVGTYAMPVLLGTPYDLYYVKGVFNSQPDALAALKVTHRLQLYPSNIFVVGPLLKNAGYIADEEKKVIPVIGQTLELRQVHLEQ